MMPMHGLLEVDVHRAKELLDAHDPPRSMTAFVVACVARAAAAHPEVHAYRDWRGRLVVHRFVDVTTLVEVTTTEGTFGLPHVLSDADVRDVEDLSTEIRSIKVDPRTSSQGRLLERAGPFGSRVPGAMAATYWLMRRVPRVRRHVGTVSVTAVGMFAGGAGFAVAPMTLASLQVVVGGMSRRPRVVDGRVEVREVLDLTVTVDHNVVDGAPAARFGAELRALLESASVI